MSYAIPNCGYKRLWSQEPRPLPCYYQDSEQTVWPGLRMHTSNVQITVDNPIGWCLHIALTELTPDEWMQEPSC